MSATGLSSDVDLFEEISSVLGPRTLEILERRRRTTRAKGRGWLVRRALLVADLVGLIFAFALAELIIPSQRGIAVSFEALAFALTLPGWVVMTKLYGLYDRDEERTNHSTADDFSGVFHLVTVGSWLFYAGATLTGFAHPVLPKVIVFWTLAVVLITTGRAAARAVCRRHVAYLQSTVIVGAGEVGQLIARKMLQHPEYGLNVVGFVDENPKERRKGLEHLALLGDSARLPAIVQLFDIERVVVAFSNESHRKTLDLIRSLENLDVQIDIVPRLFETVGPSVGLHVIEGVPLLGLPPLRLSRSSSLLKRTIDVALSTIGLVLLSPALLVIAIAVKLDSRGPIFYRHERIGRGRDRIDVIKFRTMRLEACRGERYGGEVAERTFLELMSDLERAREFEKTYKLRDDPRTTRVGRFLRRSSLDELPQLFNVLKGDLSLVGPRAITAAELTRYGERADDLLNVRPGITGYWQINGRSRLDYDERVRLDLLYILGWSLALDLTILAKTVGVVLRGRDAV